jgi:hypothetical protein
LLRLCSMLSSISRLACIPRLARGRSMIPLGRVI